MLSQVIGPLPNVEAKPLFTSHVYLHRAGRDRGRPHQGQDGAHAGIAPVKIGENRKPIARRRNLDKQLQETAEQSPSASPTSPRSPKCGSSQ